MNQTRPPDFQIWADDLSDDEMDQLAHIFEGSLEMGTENWAIVRPEGSPKLRSRGGGFKRADSWGEYAAILTEDRNEWKRRALEAEARETPDRGATGGRGNDE